MNPTQRIIQAARITNELGQRLGRMETEKQAQDQKVTALIPQVVEALVTNDRILPEQREKVAQALTDPVAALELLRDLAAHRNSAELAAIGTPTGGTKTASAQPSRFRPVGAPVSNYDETEAGQRFRQRIMQG